MSFKLIHAKGFICFIVMLIVVMLIPVILSVLLLFHCYAECNYAECRSALVGAFTRFHQNKVMALIRETLLKGKAQYG